MREREPHVVERDAVGHRVEVAVGERAPVGRDAGLSCDETSSASTISRAWASAVRAAPCVCGTMRIVSGSCRCRCSSPVEQDAACEQRLHPRDGLPRPGQRAGLADRRVERLHVAEHALERQRRSLVEAIEQRRHAVQRQRRPAERERVRVDEREALLGARTPRLQSEPGELLGVLALADERTREVGERPEVGLAERSDGAHAGGEPGVQRCDEVVGDLEPARPTSRGRIPQAARPSRPGLRPRARPDRFRCGGHGAAGC